MPIKARNGKIILTPDEIQYIQDNWLNQTNPQLAKHLGLKLTKLRDFLREMGLKRMEMEYWTPEQVDFLKKNYKKMGDIEISEIFEAEWPKNKRWTEKHIRKKRLYLNLHRTDLQLQKVKKRNIKAGRYNTVNQRWKTTGVTEVGKIKIWKKYDGTSDLVVIKLENGFVHYYRWLYIQHFGPLNSDQIVRRKKDVFKNELLTIEDLEVITRAENSLRNVEIRMSLPPEIREIIRETNKLKKTIKKVENESRNNK